MSANMAMRWWRTFLTGMFVAGVLTGAAVQAGYQEVWRSDETTGFSFELDLGDMDGDGDLDMVVTNVPDLPVKVYRNDGAGVFTLVWSQLLDAHAYTVRWVDADHDGTLDLLFAMAPPDTVRVFRGNGSGFVPYATGTHASLALGAELSSTPMGDFIALGQTPLLVDRLVPPGTTPVWESPFQEQAVKAAWGDADGDGLADLAVATGSDPLSAGRRLPDRVYRNEGNGQFSAVWQSEDLPVSLSVAWGDVEGDGDLDLMIAGQFTGVNLYRNEGGFQFTLVTSLLENRVCEGTALADMDNDHDQDLVVACWWGSYVFHQVAPWQFEKAWETPDFQRTFDVKVGDLDGDGDQDIALAGSGPEQVYFNDLNPAPPGAPVLVPVPDGVSGTVRLVWQPAPGTPPQHAAHDRYDVVVDRGEGTPVVVERSVSALSEAVVLSAGETAITWRWRVRAVDAFGLVGPFSEPDEFVLDATAPTSPRPVVDEGVFTSSSSQLSFSWFASEDPHTGLAGYDARLVTESAHQEPWLSMGKALHVDLTQLTLVQGETYFLEVRAVNGVGLLCEPVRSDGITVDAKPPAAPRVVRDGTGEDVDLLGEVKYFPLNWDAAPVPVSGLARYDVALGTEPGGQDVVAWRPAGESLSASLALPSLRHGQRLYGAVRVVNGLGTVGETVASDGVLVDLTPPSAVEELLDGAHGPDLEEQVDTGVLHARWSPARDPESGIDHYEVAMAPVKNTQQALSWQPVGAVTEATLDGLSLTVGQRYQVWVRAVNGLGVAGAPAATNGVAIVDLPDKDPPVGVHLDYPSGAVEDAAIVLVLSAGEDQGSGLSPSAVLEWQTAPLGEAGCQTYGPFQHLADPPVTAVQWLQELTPGLCHRYRFTVWDRSGNAAVASVEHGVWLRPPAPCVSPAGDVDGDCRLTVTDQQLLLDHLSGLRMLDDAALARGLVRPGAGALPTIEDAILIGRCVDGQLVGVPEMGWCAP